MAAGIPKKVQDFVGSTIQSVEQLEVLLLLQRASDREWTAEDVSANLKTQASSSAGWLADLTGRGLLAENGARYRYAPPAELRPVLEELRRCYEVYRVRLISLIFAGPSDRVQGFADAFRFRRDT